MKRAFLLSLLFLTHLAVWADEPRTNDPVAPQAASGSTNGHEWVDLGLSVKWATCNVGASTPAEYGNYFAWGETRTKSEYKTSNSATYNKSMGDIAGNPNYDVARANWGSSWRMPTKSELEELKNNCTWTWTSQGGHNGYKVTGKNGNSIFLPAAGWRSWSPLYDAGETGNYWSSTPDESNSQLAYSLYFSSGSRYVDWSKRYYGRAVRPVMALSPSERQSMAATEEQALRSEIAAGKMQQINGHELVDLGLSVKWATCNVGASTPAEYGNYYAWGETRTKSTYTKENCQTDHKSMGDIAGSSQYDAARANWGGSWRLPTESELEELKNNCTWTWTSQGGHEGYKVTGKNGNSIFLPAAGWRNGSSRYNAGEHGRYWSSTPDESNSQLAYSLYFLSGNRFVRWSNRYYGRTVRPVSD